jgi:hypothetical protein
MTCLHTAMTKASQIKHSHHCRVLKRDAALLGIHRRFGGTKRLILQGTTVHSEMSWNSLALKMDTERFSEMSAAIPFRKSVGICLEVCRPKSKNVHFLSSDVHSSFCNYQTINSTLIRERVMICTVEHFSLDTRHNIYDVQVRHSEA